MDPNQLQVLLEAMAERPGADTAAFFMAHDLESAYESPGRGASKKAKITAALGAAKRRAPHVIDEAAVKFLQPSPGSPKATGLSLRSERSANVEEVKGVFVSHSAANRDLADALVTLMRMGADLTSTEVTYTSGPGTGIPTGVPNYMDWLRKRIEHCHVFVAILTPSYLESSTCLLEFGAAWVRQTPVYPLVVPPLTFKRAEEVFGKINFGKVDGEDDLADLRDLLVEHFGRSTRTSAWNAEQRKYLAAIGSGLTKVPQSQKVERSLFEAERALREEAEADRDDALEAASSLRTKYTALKALADQRDLLEVETADATEEEEFKALVDAATSALGALAPATRYAVYFFHGKCESYLFPSYETVEREALDQARELGELDYHDEEGYSLDEDDPRVEKAVNATALLLEASWSEDFERQFRHEYEMAMKFSSRRLWEELGML